jgi:hypothetical protein
MRKLNISPEEEKELDLKSDSRPRLFSRVTFASCNAARLWLPWLMLRIKPLVLTA